MPSAKLPATQQEQRQWPATEAEADEVEEVLAILRDLLDRVNVPIVRVCLEEARDDIAHLTGSSPEAAAGPQQDQEDAA